MTSARVCLTLVVGRELALVDDQIFLTDGLAREIVFEDLAGTGGVACLG